MQAKMDLQRFFPFNAIKFVVIDFDVFFQITSAHNLNYGFNFAILN